MTSATDKANLQTQVNALKASIDALSVDVVGPTVPPATTPPAPSIWTRIAPDLFEIALTDPNAVLQAKMLDGSGGYDGLGHVIHYGDMSGGITYANGVPNFDDKFSNPSVKPKWGKYPDGTPYLESASDIDVPVAPGVTYNRLINWNAGALGVTAKQELWMRWGMYVDPRCKPNSNNLGIKLFGFGGTVPGATMAIIMEAWQLANGRLAIGTYRYDAEVTQGQEISNVDLPLGSRDIYELHVKANTMTNGVYNRDGVFEIWLNNLLIWSRKDYLFFKTTLQGQQPGFTSAGTQFYPGGTTKPVETGNRAEVTLMARFDSWAVSTKGRIGPPVGYAP